MLHKESTKSVPNISYFPQIIKDILFPDVGASISGFFTVIVHIKIQHIDIVHIH